MLCLPGSGSSSTWHSSTKVDRDQGGNHGQSLPRSGFERDLPDSAATSNGVRHSVLLTVGMSVPHIAPFRRICQRLYLFVRSIVSKGYPDSWNRMLHDLHACAYSLYPSVCLLIHTITIFSAKALSVLLAATVSYTLPLVLLPLL